MDEALTGLLAAFDGAVERLDAVQGLYELNVSWWGTSDSEQGGFWTRASLLQRLARLGVAVHGTIHFHGAEEQKADPTQRSLGYP